MRLYVIGNGFDLHHNLDTSYARFGRFLSNNQPETYDMLLDYFGFDDIALYSETDSLWSEFESNLAAVDKDTVYDAYSHTLANPASPDFRDRDWHAFAIEMETVLEALTKGLLGQFRQFIKNVEYPSLATKVNLDTAARFLTFNYTPTLQQCYGIPESNVLHIHGCEDDSDIVLGHGTDPDSFIEPDPAPPDHLDKLEVADWWDEVANRHDVSFEEGRQVFEQYFKSSFKNTAHVISGHSKFFESLSDITEVFVMGHSLSDVELPYFDVIAKRVNKEAVWIVTYYHPSEKQHHLTQLNEIGIHTPIFKKMDEL